MTFSKIVSTITSLYVSITAINHQSVRDSIDTLVISLINWLVMPNALFFQYYTIFQNEHHHKKKFNFDALFVVRYSYISMTSVTFFLTGKRLYFCNLYPYECA